MALFRNSLLSLLVFGLVHTFQVGSHLESIDSVRVKISIPSKLVGYERDPFNIFLFFGKPIQSYHVYLYIIISCIYVYLKIYHLYVYNWVV